MRHRLIPFIAALAIAAPFARANFVGMQVRVHSHAEYQGDVDDTSAVAVVGPDVEFESFNAVTHTFAIDLGTDTIRITDFDATDTWDALDFNGLIFDDEAKAIAPFTSVTVLDTTTMAGLDATRVTIGDADHLRLDWGGLSFDESTVVELRVGFGGAAPADTTAVPTPAALRAGVALIATLSLRRRRRVAA